MVCFAAKGTTQQKNVDFDLLGLDFKVTRYIAQCPIWALYRRPNLHFTIVFYVRDGIFRFYGRVCQERCFVHRLQRFFGMSQRLIDVAFFFKVDAFSFRGIIPFGKIGIRSHFIHPGIVPGHIQGFFAFQRRPPVACDDGNCFGGTVGHRAFRLHDPNDSGDFFGRGIVDGHNLAVNGWRV